MQLCRILMRFESAGPRVFLEHLAQAAARDSDLAGERHEPVELLDRHAQRPSRLARTRGRFRRLGRGRVDHAARGGGPGSGIARGQPAQDLLVRRRDLVVAFDGHGQHLPDGVDRCQQSRDEARGDGLRPLTQLLELILEGMGELRHAGETERSRVALEGVGHPEDGLQNLAVAGIALEREQAFLDRPEVFLRFRDEGQQKGFRVEFHRALQLRDPGVAQVGVEDELAARASAHVAGDDRNAEVFEQFECDTCVLFAEVALARLERLEDAGPAEHLGLQAAARRAQRRDGRRAAKRRRCRTAAIPGPRRRRREAGNGSSRRWT